MPVINDSTVVASAYTTSASARPQRLSNGWIVSCNRSSDTQYIYLQVNKFDGNGFIPLCFWYTNSTSQGYSICSYGNVVYLEISHGGNTIYFKFNATTIANINLTTLGSTQIDYGQSASGECSLAINSTGTELHACWSSKNATYPNSFNIRYVKGTISAVDGSVKWGVVEQLSTFSSTGADYTNPSIICNKNNLPVIFFALNGVSASCSIRCFVYDGVSWSNKNIYTTNESNYTQSSPSAIFVPQSINGLANGLIGNAWHGTDSASTGVNYIRFSKCVDGIGTTWSTMQKLVVGTNASLTANKNGKLFITYEDAGVTKRVESIDNGDTWSSTTIVGTGTNPSTLFDLTMNMTIPLIIRKSSSSVLFSGSWTITTISVAQGALGAKSDKANLLTYAITTDGTMSTVTEMVNGVSVGTKTLASGENTPVGLTQAQWDAIKYGKYTIPYAMNESSLLPDISMWTLDTGITRLSANSLRAVSTSSTKSASIILNGLTPMQPYIIIFDAVTTIGQGYVTSFNYTNTVGVGRNLASKMPTTGVGQSLSFTPDTSSVYLTIGTWLDTSVDIIFSNIKLVKLMDKNNLTVTMGTETFIYTFDKCLANTDDITSAMKAVQDSQSVMLPSVKAKLASAIRSKGGSVNDSAVFEDMISAVKAMGYVDSKRWAIGSITSSSSTLAFNYITTTTGNNNYVEVTGLTFKPNIIIVYDKTLAGNTYPTTYKYGGINKYNSIGHAMLGSVGIIETGNLVISYNGFKLPVDGASHVFEWIAIE
jgi:hypothetical protein